MDGVFLVLGIAFAASIFFLFVTFVLWLAAIWFTVGLSGLATIIAACTLSASLPVMLRDRGPGRYSTGVVVSLALSRTGLVLHNLAIAAALHGHVSLFG
ncbi:MAG: hypothetical protein SFU86_03795 [Pirellulaceae bacterium]|nr:hypothetical protein [Pirellulaceae bacterium]